MHAVQVRRTLPAAKRAAILSRLGAREILDHLVV